jgi:uncharacterized protein
MTARHAVSPAGTPGASDAVRATVGVVAAYVVALILAGFVGVISGAANEGVRSAGDMRAQLAVQALAFAAAALLLVEGLRLAHLPRERDPLGAAAHDRAGLAPVGAVLVAGLLAAAAALLAGPVVTAVLPGLHDGAAPIDELGLGEGLGADIGTVLVVVGLVPLGEELLFRGVLVSAWTRAGRPRLAVAISAILFGLAHATVGPRTMAITALLGLVLAVALLAGRSLGAPVLAHAIVNGTALLQAGIDDLAPLIVLGLTIVAVTAVAVRISRSVSLPAPAGTLVG